jgi:hypothetical protein
MNKKDLADLRKEFKVSTYMLSVKEIYSVYLKKDNKAIIMKELNYLDMMDVEKRELYLENFKKVLSGPIDSKIFELDFMTPDPGNDVESADNAQSVLYNCLRSGESIVEYADKLVEKIAENYNYEMDVVINFVKAEYLKGSRNRSEEADEAADDHVQAVEFILCSINKVDAPKKILKFDYSELTFKPSSAIDVELNLKMPLDGFVFPSIGGDFVDVNKIIYYSSTAKQMNVSLVENVLGCNLKPNAVEEKESFNAILHTVVGGRIKPETMQEIYEKINEKLEFADEEDEEEPTVNMKEITRVLESSGIEKTEMVEAAFEEICGGDYDFKVKNIIPAFESKSIKIENENTNVTITPRDLSSVRQVIDKKGKKYLLIELTEDVEINGFKLENEELESIDL